MTAHRPLPLMLGFGVASGLPLPLTAFTLEQWFTTAHLSVHAIGLTAFLGLPYTLKFLWSAVFDRAPPALARLGRRRAWLLLAQLALVASCLLLSRTDPAADPWRTSAAALLVALFSASQDYLIDAWRLHSFAPDDQGAALAAYIWGYRVALTIAGPGAIWLSVSAGWPRAIAAIALLLALGPALTLLAREPREGEAAPAPGLAGIGLSIWRPMRDLLGRPGVVWLVAFLILFKLGKVFADKLAAPFYNYALHFTPAAVAAANFLPSWIGSFAGAAAGAVLVARLGPRLGLLAAGTLQAASLLLYVALAWHPSGAMLVVKVSGEYFAGGAADTAFLAYLSAIASRRFAAAQYALLSSLSPIVFHSIGGFAGYAQEALGWVPFYLATVLASLPALLILRRRPLEPAT